MGGSLYIGYPIVPPLGFCLVTMFTSQPFCLLEAVDPWGNWFDLGTMTTDFLLTNANSECLNFDPISWLLN